MNRYFFIICAILLPISTYGKIRKLETTRLSSSAGAGVATILVNETAFLNPASIVFYRGSSLYYQKTVSELKSSQRTSLKKPKAEAIVIADTSSKLKGTFSYQYQNEYGERRQRLTSSIASTITKNLSFGILYKYTDEKDSANQKHKYHSANLGLTYIHSPKLSAGLVFHDAFLADKEEFRILVGVQYQIVDNLIFVLDAGSNTAYSAKDNLLNRYAFQVNFFEHFFLRAGQFYDNAEKEKGQAWGLSWIGPKLSLEYSYKTSNSLNELSQKILKNEKLIEQSFALAIRF